MPDLSASECTAHQHRLKGTVVLITGGASGLGRAVAFNFAKSGAKLVLGDIDAKGLALVVEEIRSAGGQAIGQQCDVLSWESQVSLFEAGSKAFGSIDVVLPNAGVTEIGDFDPKLEGTFDSPPSKPNLKTLDICLTAVFYTTRLALYHIPRSKSTTKAIVFTGSMSTFFGASDGPQYAAAKAGVLGVMKGCVEWGKREGVRLATICPYFTKTNILPKDFVNPNPRLGFAQIEDVVNAFLIAATDPSPETDGSVYMIPDKDGVVRMTHTGYRVGGEFAKRDKKKAKL